jgi:hypothetical protein
MLQVKGGRATPWLAIWGGLSHPLAKKGWPAIVRNLLPNVETRIVTPEELIN